MTADRKTDRHARNPVSARLGPDDDTWFRSYCARKGLKIRQGVIAAVRALRTQAEAERATTQTTPEGDQ
jgi:hypothetical protein